MRLLRSPRRARERERADSGFRRHLTTSLDRPASSSTPNQETSMSRMTRRTTAGLAACLTGLLALAACGGGGSFDEGSGTGATQSAAAGPVTIKFMITSNGPADIKLQQDT